MNIARVCRVLPHSAYQYINKMNIARVCGILPRSHITCKRACLPKYTTRRAIYCNVHLYENIPYYVGKSIIVFTMFYSTLNWLFYRSLEYKETKDEDNSV